MSELPGPLLKLVWGGALYATEEWACSVHMAGIGSGDFEPTDLTPLKAPLQDWMERITSKISTGATLGYVKLNQIARGPVGKDLPGGKQDPNRATNQLIFSPVIGGSTVFGRSPGQNTQVITLRTEISRGRGSSGRFYPPTCAGALTDNNVAADGRVIAAVAAGMADSAQELLSEINALWDIAGPWGSTGVPKSVVSVWSGAAQKAYAVERVACGRVIDTQRRRRSSLAEDPQFAGSNV
jgi:hypothetical protein